jgi:hypothetical protein
MFRSAVGGNASGAGIAMIFSDEQRSYFFDKSQCFARRADQRSAFTATVSKLNKSARLLRPKSSTTKTPQH